MPELPEVETVRRGLERTIIGKTVATVDIRVPKIFADDRALIDATLIEATITQISRRAKILLIYLSSGWVLAIHLKMTGQIIVVNSEKETVNSNAANLDVLTIHSSQFTVHEPGFVGGHPEKAYEQDLPHKHTHVIITFSEGSTLYFNDLRKFGWMRLFPDQPVPGSPFTVHEFLASLKHGPEPLEDEFTLSYFQAGLAKRSTTIKQLLLDQQFIAGIGNIYADEALFAAKILPTRRADSLKQTRSEMLFHAIKQVLQLGIDQGGTSMNSYRQVDGTKGGMREHLKVYGREGLPCLICGSTIVRKKIGQRSSHFCPVCQH